jgi:hypothetical protein
VSIKYRHTNGIVFDQFWHAALYLLKQKSGFIHEYAPEMPRDKAYSWNNFIARFTVSSPTGSKINGLEVHSERLTPSEFERLKSCLKANNDVLRARFSDIKTLKSRVYTLIEEHTTAIQVNKRREVVL